MPLRPARKLVIMAVLDGSIMKSSRYLLINQPCEID